MQFNSWRINSKNRFCQGVSIKSGRSNKNEEYEGLKLDLRIMCKNSLWNNDKSTMKNKHDACLGPSSEDAFPSVKET